MCTILHYVSLSKRKSSQSCHHGMQSMRVRTSLFHALTNILCFSVTKGLHQIKWQIASEVSPDVNLVILSPYWCNLITLEVPTKANRFLLSSNKHCSPNIIVYNAYNLDFPELGKFIDIKSNMNYCTNFIFSSLNWCPLCPEIKKIKKSIWHNRL